MGSVSSSITPVLTWWPNNSIKKEENIKLLTGWHDSEFVKFGEGKCSNGLLFSNLMTD